MAELIKKSAVSSPALPKEVVEVPELNGSVLVVGLTLTARLALFASGTAASVSQLLAMTVMDGDNQPLFSEAEWDNFGANHFKACINLFKVAKSLSGLDAEVEAKNS